MKQILVCALGLFMAGLAQAQPVTVPPGGPIALDGVLGEAEWRAARAEPLTGGGTLFLMHDEAHLYVGLRGLAQGWSHVYLPDGGAVRVLHASAALGAARYGADGTERWQPEHPFSWSLRDTSLSAAAVAERAAFLDANGWVATTAYMGRPNEIEFKVSRSALEAGRLAVVFASDAASPQFWPSTLGDDTLKEELIFGKTPEGLAFRVAEWAPFEWGEASR